MPLDLDGLEREAFARGRFDGLAEAMRLVAEITGPMKPADFNEKTWSMLCKINVELASAASSAASYAEECG